MKKVIVITGGSDGLGKTLTSFLSKDNDVIILATNEDKLKGVANENNCEYKVCDVKDYTLIESTIEDIINKFGKIDVLINNAGLWIQEELDYNDNDRIHSVVDVNLLGVINCSKAVIPFMKQNKTGLIININSQAGINHKAERVVYNARKWGVTVFSKLLQDEVAKCGIRVTNVMPGMMKTDMFSKMNIEKNGEWCGYKGSSTINSIYY